MTRVKRSIHAKKKRRATLERAKGYRGDASRRYKKAKETVMKADSYAYRDRRNRKRDFRRDRRGRQGRRRQSLITSADNAKLKLVRRLQRRRDEKLFVAEGEDLVEAAREA